jgi:hypothetical protein
MRLTKFTSALTISFVSLFFIACDDDLSEFGAEMMPASDKFTGFETDTVTVTASQYNYIEFASQSDYAYLGIATDPVFGEISASLLNEMILEEEAKNYDGLTKVVDSVRLHLYFDNNQVYKSSTNSVLSLAIYSMIDTLSLDSIYRNSLDVEHFYNSSSLLTSNDIDIQDKLVKIDFPSSSFNYFQKIVDLDSAAVNNRDSLHKAGIYGFLFKPLPGNEIIARLNTGQYDSTYMDIYFHLKDDTLSHYLRMSFISSWYDTSDYYSIIYGNAKANVIKYDYSKASVSTSLNGSTDDSLLYIFGEGGLKGKVNFSNLTLLPDIGKYNVIKAEMFIPYDSNVRSKTRLTTANLGLYFMQNTDTFKNLSDSLTYTRYKPYIDTTTDSYMFDVTEYINQKLKYPNYSNEMYLLNTASSNSFNCAILKKDRIKLKIKYTKL